MTKTVRLRAELRPSEKSTAMAAGKTWETAKIRQNEPGSPILTRIWFLGQFWAYLCFIILFPFYFLILIKLGLGLDLFPYK